MDKEQRKKEKRTENSAKSGPSEGSRQVRRIFRGNDIILSIYISFALLLALTAVLIGTIFLRMYQKNYMESYTEKLCKQSRTIADRVTKFRINDRPARFQKYTTYIDEIEKSEETDVWIVRNEDAAEPLEEAYINADTASATAEMFEVLEGAFAGSETSNSSYDRVYGMVTLRVATPIYRTPQSDEVAGAVMMISMLDKQSMGIKEGKYLITISALLGFLISYLVALAFSRYLSRPLEKIDRAIMKMAQGDYSRIAKGNSRTQLGRLENALDGLAEQLQRIESERENLDRVRQDFFANVSHELRTPITVLRGYSETLADGLITDSGQQHEFYERMVQECKGMERLVGDLFILSKMQNPDFQIEKEPVSLIQIFSDVIRNGKILGQEKNLTIEMKAPSGEPCLMLGDYDRLRQMFMVIVDNAVKFSPEGEKIELEITDGGTSWEICIRDYGIGIREEELPFIFEKFYKSKLKQNEKGTGLGLMIAKQIALRHGGDIRVESKPGEGTAFFFSFAKFL